MINDIELGKRWFRRKRTIHDDGYRELLQFNDLLQLQQQRCLVVTKENRKDKCLQSKQPVKRTYTWPSCRQSDMKRWLNMEKVAKTVNSEELSVEERNLLSFAYKNVIGACQASWRLISSIEQKEESRGNEDHVKMIKEYRANIDVELSKICDAIQKLLETHLIPSSTAAESMVFYLKIKEDYYRYLAEFKSGDGRKEAAENTLTAYKSAQDISLAEMPPTHPIRLGLALDFSVCYYEILNSPVRACNLAKQAFHEAISELDSLGEESHKDSTLIMQLLHDNLTLWTSDITKDAGDEIKDASKGEGR